MENIEGLDGIETAAGYEYYDIYKDCTQTGFVMLSPALMRLTVHTFYDALEHEISYSVEKNADIEKFYTEIGCKSTDEKSVVKQFLHKRFPQPKTVKEFIDAAKIEYKCVSSSRSVKNGASAANALLKKGTKK